METLLDLANQNQPQPTEAEGETADAPQPIEEIDTAPKAEITKALPGKAVTKPAPYKREEPPPNPLLLDPYEWDKCTITVGYSLLPDKRVSVSVHNHKDEPVVKEFPVEEVPLPEKISQVMANLQSVLAGCNLALEHVVSARIFLTHFKEDYERMNKVYAEYFPAGRRPARTCVGVSGLAREARVEIDFIARRP